MKTKVVLHVPRINISMSQTQTQSQPHWFPAFVMLTFLAGSSSMIGKLTGEGCDDEDDVKNVNMTKAGNQCVIVCVCVCVCD